jgi:hypothetical protein
VRQRGAEAECHSGGHHFGRGSRRGKPDGEFNLAFRAELAGARIRRRARRSPPASAPRPRSASASSRLAPTRRRARPHPPCRAAAAAARPSLCMCASSAEPRPATVPTGDATLRRRSTSSTHAYSAMGSSWRCTRSDPALHMRPGAGSVVARVSFRQSRFPAVRSSWAGGRQAGRNWGRRRQSPDPRRTTAHWRRRVPARWHQRSASVEPRFQCRRPPGR